MYFCIASRRPTPEFKPQYHHQKKTKPKNKQAGCRWLMPAILATQEAEIRRIKV
jgi:hypothetical protein